MSIRWDGPEDADLTVILAPGDRGQVEDVAPRILAGSLAAAGLRVARFADPSQGGDALRRDAAMAAKIREAAAARRAEHPGSARLSAALRDPEAYPGRRDRLVLAGFSRGARVSAGLVVELGAVGLVGFAYPFHDRRDPDPKGRVEELLAAGVPTLLCQGTRDSHGNREQVRGYALPERVRLHWLVDANHGLHPRARSGQPREALLAEAAAATVAFVRSLVEG